MGILFNKDENNLEDRFRKLSEPPGKKNSGKASSDADDFYYSETGDVNRPDETENKKEAKPPVSVTSVMEGIGGFLKKIPIPDLSVLSEKDPVPEDRFRRPHRGHEEDHGSRGHGHHAGRHHPDIQS